MSDIGSDRARGRPPSSGAPVRDQAGLQSAGKRSLFDRLYGFGELIHDAVARRGSGASGRSFASTGDPDTTQFARLVAEETTSIAIRKRLFPGGALRSMGWEILVALYSREQDTKTLVEVLGYKGDDCLNATFNRHVECLEQAMLIFSESDELQPERTRLRLTSDARNTMECYFRERAARIAA